jgi:hypothetical protein
MSNKEKGLPTTRNGKTSQTKKRVLLARKLVNLYNKAKGSNHISYQNAYYELKSFYECVYRVANQAKEVLEMEKILRGEKSIVTPSDTSCVTPLLNDTPRVTPFDTSHRGNVTSVTKGKKKIDTPRRCNNEAHSPTNSI